MSESVAQGRTNITYESPGPWEKFKSFCLRHCRGCDEPACRRRSRCCNEPCCRRLRKRRVRPPAKVRSHEREPLVGRDGGRKQFHKSPVTEATSSVLQMTDSLRRTATLRCPEGPSESVVKEYNVSASPCRAQLRTGGSYGADRWSSHRKEQRCHESHPFSVGVLRASYPAPSRENRSTIVPQEDIDKSTPALESLHQSPGGVSQGPVRISYDVEDKCKAEPAKQPGRHTSTVRTEARQREERSKRNRSEIVVEQMEAAEETSALPTDTTEPLITLVNRQMENLSTSSRGVSKSPDARQRQDGHVSYKVSNPETATVRRRHRRSKHNTTAVNRTESASSRNRPVQLVKRGSTVSYDLGETKDEGNSGKAHL
ncbi:hypothetical protein AAHC03_020900 [Spirometra sp. Aus1]